MKCPECGATENIKWFLRHQKEDEEDVSSLANVITILCTKCGYNESFFIEECLPGIFYNWYEPILDDLSNLNGGFFDATQDNSMFDESLFPIDEDPFPIDEENDEVINDE